MENLDFIVLFAADRASGRSAKRPKINSKTHPKRASDSEALFFIFFCDFRRFGDRLGEALGWFLGRISESDFGRQKSWILEVPRRATRSRLNLRIAGF